MKIFFLLIPILLCFYISTAQVITDDSDVKVLPATSEMIMQVKTLGQFIERFNYEKTPNNKPVDGEFKKQINRAGYIKLLIDVENPKLKTKDSTIYINKVKAFINEATGNKPLFLDMTKNEILAFSQANALYRGKKIALTIMHSWHFLFILKRLGRVCCCNF